MKKHKKTLTASLFIALFATFLIFLSIGQLQAEDSLPSFIREIIQAKEKQVSFTNKMQHVHLALDADRTTKLEEQADQFIRELEVPKPAPKVVTLAKTEVKPAQIILTPPQTKKASPIPLLSWKNFMFRSKSEPKLTDGEALYKVAVSDKKITVREAIDIAIANSIQVQANKKKIEAAGAKLVEAKRALFPTAEGVIEVNGGRAAGRFYKGESRKLNVTQPLYYGGELVLTVKQAEENLKSVNIDHEKAKNELVHQVRTAYYGAVKAEYNAQYHTELAEKTTSVYKRMKNEFSEKLMPEVDFLNVESQYQQLIFQVQSAQSDLESAKVLLYQTVNVDSGLDFPIDHELRFIKVSPRFQELIDLATSRNPDVLMKASAMVSAKYGMDIYKAKKMPHIDLRGSYGMLGEAHHDTLAFTEGKADNDLEKEWFLGVHGSMPLGASTVDYDQVKHKYGPTVLALTGSEDWRHKVSFNLLNKLSDVTDGKVAEATYLQSKQDYEKAKNEITIKLRDDFYTLQKSLIQIDSAIAKIRYQDKQNSLNEYLLGLQETSPANYFEGLMNLVQYKFSFIQAVTDYHLAVSGVSVAVGDPYYFENKPENRS